MCDTVVVFLTKSLSNIAPSRRDDIEGLLYVIIYLMRGNLPWQKATSDQEGARMKRSIPLQKLCESLPRTLSQHTANILSTLFSSAEEWTGLLQQSRACAFEDKPDYDSYRKTFRKLAGEFKPGDPIVWNTSKNRDPVMIKSVARATSDASSPPRKRAAGKRVPVKQTKAKQSNAKKSLKEAKKDTIKTSKKTSGRKRMTAKKN